MTHLSLQFCLLPVVLFLSDAMLSVMVFIVLFFAGATTTRLYQITEPIIRSLDLASLPLQETESVGLPPPPPPPKSLPLHLNF